MDILKSLYGKSRPRYCISGRLSATKKATDKNSQRLKKQNVPIYDVVF
jgi:hypothetical protein